MHTALKCVEQRLWKRECTWVGLGDPRDGERCDVTPQFALLLAPSEFQLDN